MYKTLDQDVFVVYPTHSWFHKYLETMNESDRPQRHPDPNHEYNIDPHKYVQNFRSTNSVSS